MIIRDELSTRGIALKNFSEGNHKALCPKCSSARRNKTDLCLSVTIETDGAVWKCHNCGWADGARPRVEQEPYRRRAAKPVVKPRHEPGDLTKEARSWLNRRGISDATLARNKIGSEMAWMPGCGDGETASVITFPYLRNGEVVNVKYRTSDKRFRQVKDAEKVFYGLDDIAGADTVIITEGEIDKLSLEESGFKNAVSVPDGAPKTAREDVPDPEDDTKFSYVWNCRSAFEGVTRIILATDGDGPGQALAEELARRLGRFRCYTVTWPDGNDAPCKDANETLMLHGKEALAEAIAAARPIPIQGLYEADIYFEDVLRIYRGETDPMFGTGFQCLDKLVKARTGDLWVWTGAPSSGKSQLLDNINVHLAKNHGWRFALCSFENPPKRHIPKLISIYTGAPFRDGWRQRMLESEVRSAMPWVSDHFKFIRAENEAPTIDWILEKARAAVLRYGIKGLVIDPYNEIEHKRPNNQSETEYVSEMLGKVKRFAEDCDVLVNFVAHPAKPRRDSDDPPSLYDISGSANWANKADIGIVVVRDYEVQNLVPKQFAADIHVKKVRWEELGTAGEARLNFDRATGRYWDGNPETGEVE